MQLEMTVRPHMQAVDAGLVRRQPSMTKALQLCQTLSGLEDGRFYGPHGIVKDQAQWSRIMGQSNSANFPQDKLNLFMDLAGNEAPLLWLVQSRGYDTGSLRLQETQMERELRQANEQLAQERAKNRILIDAMHGRVTS